MVLFHSRFVNAIYKSFVSRLSKRRVAATSLKKLKNPELSEIDKNVIVGDGSIEIQAGVQNFACVENLQCSWSCYPGR